MSLGQRDIIHPASRQGEGYKPSKHQQFKNQDEHQKGRNQGIRNRPGRVGGNGYPNGRGATTTNAKPVKKKFTRGDLRDVLDMMSTEPLLEDGETGDTAEGTTTDISAEGGSTVTPIEDGSEGIFIPGVPSPSSEGMFIPGVPTPSSEGMFIPGSPTPSWLPQGQEVQEGGQEGMFIPGVTQKDVQDELLVFEQTSAAVLKHLENSIRMVLHVFSRVLHKSSMWHGLVYLFAPSLLFMLFNGGAIEVRGSSLYAEVVKPAYSVSPTIFSYAWPFFSLFMGVAGMLIAQRMPSANEPRKHAHVVFALMMWWSQLISGFIWMQLFQWRSFNIAFFHSLFVVLLTFFTTTRFYRINNTAGHLMAVYNVWLLYVATIVYFIWELNQRRVILD